MFRFLIIAALIGVAGAASGDASDFSIADDRFLAGDTVTHDEPGMDDLFMAGESVVTEAAISGSAHLAGRKIEALGDVGGDLYAAGMDVSIEGAVAGDATVAGYDIDLGAVGGDLRVTGSEVELEGPVGGAALIAGDEVEISGVVTGDASIAARSLEFGPVARIDGRLTLYEEEPGALDVPERVAPADRIERRGIERWEGGAPSYSPVTWGEAIGGFIIGVVVIAGLAILAAALAPTQLAGLRRMILEAPFRTLWLGFLAQSALVGAAVLLAMTLIGVIASPAAILAAAVVGVAGYVVAVYALGVWLTLAFGRAEPDDIRDRAIAAGCGALAAGVVALVPLLGWLFMLAMALTGAGALCRHLFRPSFFGARA